MKKKKPSVLDILNSLKPNITWARDSKRNLSRFDDVEMSSCGRYARIPSFHGETLEEGVPESECSLTWDKGPWSSIICVKYGDFIYWFYHADSDTKTVPSRLELGL